MSKEEQAKARLIAAAPDLLEALRSMMTWGLEPDAGSRSIRDRQLAAAWAKARAAMAKVNS